MFLDAINSIPVLALPAEEIPCDPLVSFSTLVSSSDIPQVVAQEIGSLLGITRERVRQIKEKALLRLRHASRARFLETFMQ